MRLDRVSNPGPLACESGALPIALRGPAFQPSLLCHLITLTFPVLTLHTFLGKGTHERWLKQKSLSGKDLVVFKIHDQSVVCGQFFIKNVRASLTLDHSI